MPEIPWHEYRRVNVPRVEMPLGAYVETRAVEIERRLYEPEITTGTVNPWRAWVTEAATGETGTPINSPVWKTWSEVSHKHCESIEERKRREWNTRQRDLITRNRIRAESLRSKFADKRAEALLLEHLNSEQTDEYREGHCFTVHTANGARAYRIACHFTHNITVTVCDEQPESMPNYCSRLQRGMSLCGHVYSRERVPNCDNMLAQKLMLEACEDEFLAMANAG